MAATKPPKDPVVDWLLDATTPSIKYFTERDLMGLTPSAPEALRDRKRIMETGPVPVILSRQSADGNWKGEHSYYTPKYVSSHWSLLLMAEMEADGRDIHFRRGVDFMLAATKEECRLPAGAERVPGELACFWGNLLRYARQVKPADDPPIPPIVHRLAEGICQGPGQCSHNGNQPCAWGIARALWGLAAIPPASRSHTVRDAMVRGVDFLLQAGRLEKGEYPASRGGKIHSMWRNLNFPLFYQADILFVLRVLDELNALDRPEAAPALDWLAGRRKANGRWQGTSPFRSRTWKALGGREETDRWVTLQAVKILRHAGRVG
jgi:hypothetical protein